MPEATAPAAASTLALALLKGRIVGKPRQWSDGDTGRRIYATRVKLPAPTEFDDSQEVEVRSAQPLGGHGDQVHLKVRIGGWSRRFTYKDKESGQDMTGHETTITLTVVE